MLIAHVPTPLASKQSSPLTVIQSLCTEHAAMGQPSIVVISHNRDVLVRDAGVVRVDYTRYCPREWFNDREMRMDHVAGLIGLRRRYSGRRFIPAIEALRARQPDVVLLHEAHHASPSLPYWRSLYPAARVILYVHTPLSRGYRRRELRRFLSMTDGLVFVSGHAEQALRSRSGAFPVPSVVVHNGVDLSMFNAVGRPRADRLRVTYVGEIEPHKGVDLLLTAIPHALRMSRKGISVQVVGSSRGGGSGALSTYERSLRALAESLGLHYVDWIPRLPHETMPDIYRASDVVCVPSVWDEPFGMVVVEALACGAAVIASPRGGLREAGGEAAVYVDTTDSLSFGRAIADFANNPELLVSRAQRGVAYVGQRTWGHSYRALIDGLATFEQAKSRTSSPPAR